VCLIGVGKKLIQELEIRFPTHGVMDVLGIVYSSYFLQLDSDVSFAKHLEILKIFFYYNKTHKVDLENVMVQDLLNANGLDY
jgi:hypothetical protein